MELNQSVCEFVMRLLDLAHKSKALYTRSDLRYSTLTLEFVKSRAAATQPAFVTALKQLQ
jgi:hypothetical protein